MVSIWYIIRLIRSTFFQWPLKFRAPAPDLTGKTAIVTGGNAGIGLETVRHLAQLGAVVYMGCRSTSKGKKAVQQLEKEAGRALDIHVVELDLADLTSVATFAKRIKQLLNGRSLDLLVHNAGIMDVPYAQSKQGHELHFATNHLGNFLLTNLLLSDITTPGGRIVFVNAELHTLVTDATPDYKYNKQKVIPYARSKLASLWFAYELQRRRPDLTVPVLHPGVIKTDLAKDAPSFVKILFISPKKGAETTLYCCLAKGVKGLTYYHNSLGVIPSSAVSYDVKKAKAMWELSEKLTQSFHT